MTRRPANAVLAAWVLAASTCGSVTHAHPEAAAPHSHGLGLIALGSRPAGQDPVDEARHRHVVVFGVETGSLPADPGDGSTPAGDAENHVALGLGAAHVEATDDAPAVWLTDAPPAEPTWTPFVVLTDAPLTDPSAPFDAGPCPKAAGARSGVLRS